MLDIVTAKQWDSASGGFKYKSLTTGLVSLDAVIEMVDVIAATPSLDVLGDEYGGSRGWIISQTDNTIFHAYIDDIAKVEYFGVEGSAPLETDGVPGLYDFINVETLKRVFEMLDESKPIADFIKNNSVAPQSEE